MIRKGRLKVLVSAYACEPGKGSEPGVGWNWAKQIARYCETWVVTRSNNRGAIEKELLRNPEPNLHFIYVDLRPWLRFWKKGRRGIHLYYYLWQVAAYFKARRISRQFRFDISHNVTFVNDWMPSYLCLLPVPFVWGPLGSNSPFPKGFVMGTKNYVADRAKHLIRGLLRRFDPLFLLTFLRSRGIILISEDQLKLYPFSLKKGKQFCIAQANGVEIGSLPHSSREDSQFTIYSAGSLIPIKGFELSIKAFARAYSLRPDIHFNISGDGYFKNSLLSLLEELDIIQAVTFTGNLKREDVLGHMKTSHVFIFPSFEGGGMVVLEAMSLGLPVICLDYGGPGQMVTDECGIKVNPATPEQTVTDLAEAVLKLAADPELRLRMGDAGRRRVEEMYSWEKKGELIMQLYETVLKNEDPSRP